MNLQHNLKIRKLLHALVKDINYKIATEHDAQKIIRYIQRELNIIKHETTTEVNQ